MEPGFGSASASDYRSLTASLEKSCQEKLWLWDNWSYAISAEERDRLATEVHRESEAVELLQSNDACFVIGVLNAPREYYDGALGPNQHHFHSRLGTALTSDFKHFVGLRSGALTAQRDESSIWTGTFARAPISPEGRPQYLLFYTCRDPNSPFGFSQAVRVAVTNNFLDFTRLSQTITADGRWYEQHTVPGDTAIHAFRDPFPIRVEGQDYLLISAKSTALQRGEIGNRAGANGVIAVYRLDLIEGSLKAIPTPLCFAGGKPEMEVPSLYWDARTNEHVLCYSAHPDSDYVRRQADERGLPVGTIAESGVFYEARLQNLGALLRNPPTTPVMLDPHEVANIPANSYANRWIPELGGAAFGFDLASGELTLSAALRPGWESAVSDFSGDDMATIKR